MAADVEWIPNPAGVRELLTSSQALAAIGEVAAIAGHHVERAQPVKTGYHRRAIVTGGAEVTPTGAAAYVGTTSSTWHLLEYGSVNNPPHRPFARGIAAAGLDFEPTGRGG